MDFGEVAVPRALYRKTQDAVQMLPITRCEGLVFLPIVGAFIYIAIQYLQDAACKEEPMPLIALPTAASLHVEQLAADGAAEPVIVLHGLLGTARGQLGAVMDGLQARGFPVVGVTLRGYGESQPKPRDFPGDFYQRDCDDVMALMDALGIRRAHLLGYSDGGEVALLAAGQQPARFASCLVIGAVGNFGAELRPHFQRIFPGDWITAEEKREHGIGDAAQFTGQWLRAMTRLLDRGGDLSLRWAGAIRCPLLIVLGRRDTLNPACYGERFVQKTPRGRLALFDCGHAVHDEMPRAFMLALFQHLDAAQEP